ncbi:hypothetical protein QUF80_06785 [Desulfococcaceae bacterium HSG8]|nr:hypothetical protein [Desulfococcaceae bacterium HSG8]
MIVQIYEVQTPSEAEPLIELGTDHIGSVILSEASWKISSIRDTVRMAAAAGCRSSLIPLFSTPDTIFHMLDYYQPDIIHFCETLADQDGTLKNCKDLADLQKNVKKNFPEIRIMRSIPIAQPGKADLMPSLEAARIFEPISDYFLTDTFLVNPPSQAVASEDSDQPVSGFVGITGLTCDWDIATKLVEMSSIPVILAGGISPDNVSDGIRHVRPAGVDSCTGTNALDKEGRPIRFKKDFDKVKYLIETVRNLKLPVVRCN